MAQLEHAAWACGYSLWLDQGLALSDFERLIQQALLCRLFWWSS